MARTLAEEAKLPQIFQDVKLDGSSIFGRNGQTMLSFNPTQSDYRPVVDAVHNFVAEAHRLQVQSARFLGPSRTVPRLFLSLDKQDIKLADTILVVEIKDESGRVGRVQVSLSNHNGNVKATMNTPSRNADHPIERTVHFARWDD